jgi:hypothetical protein
VTQPLLLALLLLIFVGGLAALLYRGLLMSLAVRLLASRLSNAAKRHRVKIHFGHHEGGWIQHTLQADLGKILSQVLGYPVEAAAYSRFGGFNLSRLYSDFLNPDSPYYQCWLGAYVVFDGPSRKAFGFDEQGKLVHEDAVAVLEADQHLVFRSAGCPHRFPDGSLVRLRGLMQDETRKENGLSWSCTWGEADTWSAYHKGLSPGGGLRSRIYGVVPRKATHQVDDYHPLRYRGEFWMRYFPDYGATCAKFYIWPSYDDLRGQRVSPPQDFVVECQQLLTTIVFSRD